MASDRKRAGVLSTPAARWTVVAAVAIVGLVFALVSTLGDGPGGGIAGTDGGSGSGGQGPGSSDLADGPRSEPRTALSESKRAEAGLPSCRGTGPAATGGPLSEFRVGCMADGTELTLGELQGDKPLVLNIWAYWCEPCRHELPALRDAQETLGDEVRVATVHANASETKGLSVLSELGIDLVATEDPEQRLGVELGAPPVLPLTVFLDSDGSLEHVLVEPMYSEADVLEAVEEYLGVRA